MARARQCTSVPLSNATLEGSSTSPPAAPPVNKLASFRALNARSDPASTNQSETKENWAWTTLLLAADHVKLGVVSAWRMKSEVISAVPLPGMVGVMEPPAVVAVDVETTVSKGRATVATASESWHS